MLRIVAVVGFWCVALVSSLVASRDYWVPVFVSLVSTVLYARTVYPYWQAKRQRLLILLASAPLAVLTGHTVLRLSKLISL
jgi:hypothetical protein